MSFKLAVLPGDGIGPEVTGEALKLLEAIVETDSSLDIEINEYDVGGASIDKHGEPLKEEVLADCKDSDAILLGAVGGPKWDELPVHKRPEHALLSLRKQCELFANLRPARVYSALVDSSPLKNEIAENANLLIVRELTGGLYFALPRGIEGQGTKRRGFNTLSYSALEVKRITEVAVRAARRRFGRLTSVDKANVLESSKVWRETVVDVVPDDIELDHLYVDNAAMQLIRDPRQFDVIVTGNMFGDILSDAASQITGSIGLLPSASLGEGKLGMYEPVHGSAPDIAGEGKANPLATILSLAMMFRYSMSGSPWAERIETAVENVVNSGARTADMYHPDKKYLSTAEMGREVLNELNKVVGGED
ncbi:MAG: 3-isopropylmalate dehydrogenase [bacterium]